MAPARPGPTATTFASGLLGSGTLSITHGGSVSNAYGDIGLHFRLYRYGDGGWRRLDLEQQRRPLRRLLRRRNALDHQRRHRQQCKTATSATRSGSPGMVTVDGAGSTWTNSGDLYVGYSDGAERSRLPTAAASRLPAQLTLDGAKVPWERSISARTAEP